MERARLGIAEHTEAEHEGERRGVPQLEQRPRQRDAEDDPAGEAFGLAPAGVGFGDELFEIDARCGPGFHHASPDATPQGGRSVCALRPASADQLIQPFSL
jgi:hypothetical protein